MSMELMVKAMKAKVGNPLRKLVLLKLADNANDQGECWPSYQYIADQCEIGHSTVRKHIGELVKAGFVSVQHRKGPKGSSTNVYTISICHDIAPSTLPDSTHKMLPDSRGVPPDSRPPMSPDSTGISHSLEPVNESLKDLVTTSKKLALDFSKWPALPSDQVFKDWLAVRRQKKAKLTQTTVNRLARHLVKAVDAGCSVDAVFELCVSRCWIGFEFDWLVNAGLVARQAVKADWSHAVFNPEDPLI
ncbi:helix-turn-helix domain-containing protein [Shewanella glacialimarina]|uniref:helix-turn-helix domain-containing protein n=1 Tax=Shewanella glacialimarina TaxID=2590884 RepID=UPI001CF8116C|nr:helix-turn-helix domain-containing protein [Shewanella glacialimarina]UCX03551.1 helix-turn-helix domain-containing protein [Shewanella glacialimarina]